MDVQETTMDHSGKRFLLQPFLAVLWRCTGLQSLFIRHRTRVTINRQEEREYSANILPQLMPTILSKLPILYNLEIRTRMDPSRVLYDAINMTRKLQSFCWGRSGAYGKVPLPVG